MVRVVINLGAGAASLIRMPLEQYRRDGNVLRGVERGLKTFSVEVLSLGSRVSSLSYKILRGADNALKYSDDGETHPTDSHDPVATSSSSSSSGSTPSTSLYADQPASITDGLAQGWQHMREGVTSGIGAVTTEPYRQYRSHGALRAIGAAVYGIPRMVIRPALGVTGALGKMTQAVKNSIDPESKLDADNKWKENS